MTEQPPFMTVSLRGEDDAVRRANLASALAEVTSLILNDLEVQADIDDDEDGSFPDWWAVDVYDLVAQNLRFYEFPEEGGSVAFVLTASSADMVNTWHYYIDSDGEAALFEWSTP